MTSTVMETPHVEQTLENGTRIEWWLKQNGRCINLRGTIRGSDWYVVTINSDGTLQREYSVDRDAGLPVNSSGQILLDAESVDNDND